MKPGQKKRNAIIGGIALLFFPLTLLVLTFYLPIAIGLNRNGLADIIADSQLSRIPGLDAGGWKAASVSFIGLLVLTGAVIGALPGGSTDTGSNSTSETIVSNTTTQTANTPSTTTATATPTRTATATPTATTTTTATPTPTQASSGPWQPSRPLTASLINTRDKDNDGYYESFDLAVRAATSMDTTDPEGSNPGEPGFNVLANGEYLTGSGQIDHTDNGSFTVNVPESSLESYGRGEIRLKVQLVDDDPGFDNQVIQARQFEVSFEPTTTTTTATPTATPTATATQTTAAPTEATETSESESGSPGEEGRRATVTRVIDSDTVEVEFEDGETDTVRLLGVDTPETTLGDVDPPEYEGIPDNTAGRDHLFNWGERASDYATEELEGETVRVATDPEADRRGSFDRLLAYIYVDGENFNLGLIEQGYARMYDSSFSQRSDFADAEEEARSENEGLWDFDGSTSTPTETETATATPTDDSDGSSDLPPPSGGSSDPYDCPDFDSKQQAQEYFENNNPDEDPSGLDRDDDGEACDTGVD